MKSEINSFTSLRRFLAGIEYINRGGCGYAAYIMYEWLKKKNKKSEIVYFYNDYSNAYDCNEEFLSGKRKKPSSCTHSGILYNGKYIDSEKVIPKKFYDKTHIVTPEFVEKSISNKNEWNNDFDRKHYVPIMEQMTGIKISNFK